jgi:NAD(P)-dependent dehydrogenase (short-subunit alcohol dehydrogenase family)
MELHLKGKSIVITGGGTGIGKEAAREFFREGAVVSICGRTLTKLESMRNECKNEGFTVDIYQADVADTKAIETMAETIAAKHGIDVWINNAGITVNKPVLDFTQEDWDSTININLAGVYEGSRIAARHMIKQNRGGVIINVSSYSAKIAHSSGAIYSATKAGVSSLSKSFAANLAPYGIRVISLIPGMIETDISREAIAKMRPFLLQSIVMQRLGLPEDMAKPMVFLASGAAGYITGVDIEISGGKFAVQDPQAPWEWKKNAVTGELEG